MTENDKNSNKEESGEKRRRQVYQIELCDLNGPDGDLLVEIAGRSLNPTWPPRREPKK